MGADRLMHTHLKQAVAVLVMGAVAAACAGSSSGGEPVTATTTAPPPGLTVVALGDSETTGSGDPTGLGWVGRYARLLHTKLHLEVSVANLALDGRTSEELLDAVRHDPATRAAIAKAQVVLVGVGGADLNAGDDAFRARRCYAEACYRPVLKAFARNFDATIAAIRKIRGSKITVLRSITQPNPLTGAEDVIPPFLKPVATRVGVYTARTANSTICRVMARYEGRCIDVLTPFNGRDGTANAYEKGLLNHEDCCYPGAKGQQLMARLLFKTGLAPLR
jgi:lysophospholipase L1-like esterase